VEPESPSERSHVRRYGDLTVPAGAIAEDVSALLPGRSWRASDTTSPLIVQVITGSLALVLTVYALWLAAGPYHPVAVRDLWLSQLTLALASALTFLRAIRRPDGRPWLVIALGMAVWAVGDGIFSYHVEYGQAASGGALVDTLYLVFYPCMYIGLVLLLRQHVQRFQLSVALDGLLVALGVAAFGSLSIRATVASGQGLLTTVINTAYPAGDALLLVLSLSLLTLIGWRGGWRWWCIAAGCAVYTAADTAFLLQGNAYHPGTILDAGWPAGMVLIAVAGWVPDRAKQAPRRRATLLVLPTGVALTSIGFLVAASRRSLPEVGVVLAACALIAVLVRGALSYREISMLAETRRQANTDELTGLANRRKLYQMLDSLIADVSCKSFAVLLLDLDRFKEVNDALGHVVGDELLAQLGAQLSLQVRDTDLVARLGGDEFALLLGPGSDAVSAAGAAQRTLDMLSRPFTLNDVSLHVDASLGVALYPDHGQTHAELLRCADVAMYRAKRARCGFAVCTPASDVHNKDRLLTIEQLRVAIEGQQLVSYFQPKVDLRSGSVAGAEALVRWIHPDRGVLLPAEFIPLAEQTGLMSDVLLTVLDQALDQCRLWRRSGHEISVAVNLSVTNLLDASLCETVGTLLRRHDLSAGALELEITEDVLMADPHGARSVLEELRSLGSSLSLDDYGTGYNSLAHLQTWPVDELKLDRTFITGIASDPKGRAIVQATVTLARSLGLGLVAEGVESASDWDEVARLGVGMAQGFWIGHPLPPADFARWLDDHRAGLDSRQGDPATRQAVRG
jgi:diguanylate cyclase (GGDEF)-like protein